MRKKQLEARRQRNRALAIEDAKHRCSVCKRALPRLGVLWDFGGGRRYCSDACLEDAINGTGSFLGRNNHD